MSSYQWGYVTGAAAVILLAVVVFYLFRRKGGSMKGEYDERQLAIRGRAYRLATFIYIAEFGLLLVFEGMKAELPLTRGAMYAIFLLIPIGVFAVWCILHDAYIGIQSNVGRFFLLSGFICLIEAFVTVRYCMEGEMIRDGKLTDSVLAPAIMVLFGVVAVTLLIRQRQVRLEDSVE
jgi:hypothetical protein